MKAPIFICLSLLAFSVKAQKTEFNDTLFFNAHWEICEKPIASFYRLGKLVINNYAFFTGEVKDYYIDGSLQMKGSYDKEGFKQGVFTYYYPSGKVERQGSFEHNDMKGIWDYYNKEGTLKLTINCESSNSFTPLLIINRKGDTLLNNGSGSFTIDVKEYPDIFYNSSTVPVRFIEGTYIKGLRDGDWKYYELPGIYSTYVLQVPQKKLIFEERYKSGKLRSNPSGNYISILPQKDLIIDKFKGDRTFGTTPESQVALAQFLFHKVAPIIKSSSSSIKNNIEDYVTSVANAINLSKNISMFPPKGFDKEGYLLYSNIVALEPDDTLPIDVKASIQFRLMPDGDIKDIEIKGQIEPAASEAIQYYLSKLSNLSPCNEPAGCMVHLRFNVENEIGSFEGIKAYATNAEIKYADKDSSYRNILVRNSAFIVGKESEFPGGAIKWQIFLNDGLRKVMFSLNRATVEAKVQTIIVQFIVDEEGNVGNVEVISPKDANPVLAEKSIQVIKKSPRWIPAEFDGKKLKSYKKQPITWNLQDW